MMHRLSSLFDSLEVVVLLILYFVCVFLITLVPTLPIHLACSCTSATDELIDRRAQRARRVTTFPQLKPTNVSGFIYEGSTDTERGRLQLFSLF